MALIPGTTTEWEDIQVRMGNFEEREKDPCRDELEQQLIAAAEDVDVLARTSLKTLERLCENDGVDDDELLELERIRNARLEEIRTKQNEKKKFGQVMSDITRSSFVQDVTEASKQHLVISHLFSRRSVYCTEMIKLFDFLAAKYPDVKFCRGVASEVVGDDFPESNLPYVVVYSEGKCVSQLNRARTSDIVSAISEYRKKGLSADDDTGNSSSSEDDDDKKFDRVTGMVMKRVSKKYNDDADDDREFSSVFLNKHVLRRMG